MASHRLFVFTQPVEGKDAEYNDWYDKIHLKEVLEIEGFVAAQRFALAEGPADGEAPAAPAPWGPARPTRARHTRPARPGRPG